MSRLRIGPGEVVALLWASGLLLGPPRSALAGNVLAEIECGNPPRLAVTRHEARSRFDPRDLEPEADWLTPMAGSVSSLHIDGRAVTLTDGQIRRGFVETEDFGRVFLFVDDDRGEPGYFLIVRLETAERLEKGWARIRSDAAAEPGSSVP